MTNREMLRAELISREEFIYRELQKFADMYKAGDIDSPVTQDDIEDWLFCEALDC
jgi:hypothetical protein